MQKKAFIKDLLRSIYKSKTRFLSILIIIAIGVGFYAGINATEPDMILSADKYYKDRNLSDFRIVSPLGFQSQDIGDILAIEGVEKVQEGYSKDLFLTSQQGNRSIIKLFSYNEADYKDNQGISQPLIKEGRMPKDSGEIVVEHGSNLPEEIEIGSEVTLTVSEGEERIDYLERDSYTVVGTIQSPLYIELERGQTNIGDGSIDFFAYAYEEDFTIENSTDIFVETEGSKNLIAYSDEYNAYIAPIESEIEALGIGAMDRETQELREELNEGKEELEENKKKAQEELDNAEEELEEAQREIEEGEQELRDNEIQYRTELEKQEEALEEGREELEEGTILYQENYEEWQEGYREYAQGLEELNAGKDQLDEAQEEIQRAELELAQGKAELDEAEEQLYYLGEALDILRNLQDQTQDYSTISQEEWAVIFENLQVYLPEETEFSLETIHELLERLDEFIIDLEAIYAEGQEEYQQGLLEYQQALEELEEGRQELDKQRTVYQEGVSELEDAKTLLDEGERQLNAAWAEIVENEQAIEEGMIAIADAQHQLEASLEEGYLELEQARSELEEGWQSFEQEKEDILKEIQEAEEEIQEAERDILEIPTEWFVNNRDDNPGYAGYGDNADRIGAVAKVFPLFFFLVAGLVCLTTMTRMMEEERVQIGTLKALGYHTMTISSKYIIYGFLSSLIGALIGLSGGFRLFPLAIMNAYGYMYNIPERITPYHMDYAMISIAIALITTMATVVFATLQELRMSPANLMQAKAPKPGKRILLERFTPLWKRFSFTQKVTARNIFRYKKRFLMTVLGISGCTALLITGFGLRDSINGVMDTQFEDIFLYDAIVMFDTDKTESQEDFENIFEQQNDIDVYMATLNENINTLNTNSNRSYEANLMVPEDAKNFENYFDLHERESQEDIELTSEGLVITEKLSELLEVVVGDSITFRDADNISYEAKIEGIAENYLSHYIYMTPEYYEEIAAQKPRYNTAIFNIDNPQDISEQEFKEEFISNDEVLSVIFTEEMTEEFTSSMEALDSVMWILIASAGALAFVVLYNLTNINITERIREIATIKVLGFRDKEVSAYVYRENMILTLIGSLVGLLLGMILHGYVINTMELDAMMFGRDIHLASYGYSVALTMIFAILVNIFMYQKLKNVNMVESLKSID